MAIDERRRMFRVNRWIEPQPFIENPFSKTRNPVTQNIKQVWFAGVHADIGGGYPEEESGLAKFPLDWMVREAAAHGLEISKAMYNHIILGRPRVGAKTMFVRPDAKANAHDSMSWGWRPLEWIPKSSKWREWPRTQFCGLYLPQAEPRLISNGEQKPLLHQSVVDRIRGTQYRPENVPQDYQIEPCAMTRQSR